MESVLLLVHLMITIVLIGAVLLQRSEGGALGMGGGGGGGGFGSLMSGRSAASALTKTTALLAAAFFLTSIGLSLLGGRTDSGSLLDRIDNSSGGNAPLQLPSDAFGGGGAADSQPAVPDSR